MSSQHLSRLRVNVFPGGFNWPIFVAIEKGYHRDEGLTVEMIRAGGGVATQALIAGDLHFSTSAGSALGAMLRGADIKVIYTNIDRPGYQLWSGQPEIKTLKDLIGKRVGVTSRGDPERSLRVGHDTCDLSGVGVEDDENHNAGALSDAGGRALARFASCGRP